MSVTPLRVGTSVPDKQRDGYLTARDVIEATGISYRQLDYWVRTGRINCAETHDQGSGYTRYIPESELPILSDVARLLKAGLTLDAAFDAASEMGDCKRRGLMLPGEVVIVLMEPKEAT
jgi:hypothetical protein